MAYLATPGPTPTLDDRDFWDWCRRHELRFQRCANCHTYRHPPMPACRRCRSCDCEWVQAPGLAHLFSYTLVYHPVSELVKERVPYNIAIVSFPGLDGVRLISNIIGVGPQDIRIGMELGLFWDVADNGLALPGFVASVPGGLVDARAQPSARQQVP